MRRPDDPRRCQPLAGPAPPAPSQSPSGRTRFSELSWNTCTSTGASLSLPATTMGVTETAFALARRAQHPNVERAGNLARPQGTHGRTALHAPGGKAARCQPGQHVIAAAPQDLLRREPQNPLCGRVPGHDGLVERHGVDAELGRLEQPKHVTGSHKLNCLKSLSGEAARRITLSATCNDSRSPLCRRHHSRRVDIPSLGRCDARPFRCRTPMSLSRRSSCLTCSMYDMNVSGTLHPCPDTAVSPLTTGWRPA